MFVFRITLTKYADSLVASGRAARWNSNDIKVIYTSGSRALACLENVVHRSKLGLSTNFSVMQVEIPNSISVTEIYLKDLPKNWDDFEHMHFMQKIGNQWIKDSKTAILKVPSSIIHEEFNYLLNPNHPNFNKIKLKEVLPFLFDDRIKN
ncbi:RES family NAD+ phosphorylase [Pedobacter jamesrossensis]|uniref:RES family NAD+ phosphorylase n=1 Tax=Pedobacter jamesrossensis TaxID=1908238 RepID=A0ABV8NRX7_9SPHI